MSRTDWNRPRYRTAGRLTESIAGDVIPEEFRRAPRRPPPSKDSMRAQADRAVREYEASRGVIRKSPPAEQPTRPGATARRPGVDRSVVKPKPGEAPPWE
jgi:hypothetical protein